MLAFHIKHGSQVELSCDNKIVKNNSKFINDVLFSADALNLNDSFEVIILEGEGCLSLGVTTTDPSSLPEVPHYLKDVPNSWVVDLGSYNVSGKPQEKYHDVIAVGPLDKVVVTRLPSGSVIIKKNLKYIGRLCHLILEPLWIVFGMGRIKKIMVVQPETRPMEVKHAPAIRETKPNIGTTEVRLASGETPRGGLMDWICSFFIACTLALVFVFWMRNIFKNSTDEGTKKTLEPGQGDLLGVLKAIFLCACTALLGWKVYLFASAPGENKIGLNIPQTCLPSHKVLKDELHKEKLCEYWKLGARFMDSLYISAPYFYSQADLCYCKACVSLRGDQPYYKRGVPPKTYGLPIGWCRYGLSTGPQAEALNAFSTWHVGFHGTTPGKLKSILDSRDLLMPGDTAFTGERLEPPTGHFTEEIRPAGFDIKQIFVTPTIRYAGLPVYAKRERWIDPMTKKTYIVQVVLQLRIKPGSYTVGRDTVGLGKERIDPKFDNGELEWSTKLRGSTIPTGILVRLV